MAARTSNGRELLLASVTILPSQSDGFANTQVRRIVLARADENTPERFVVGRGEVWTIVLQVSANRNRKGGQKAAGWCLAANRFPEMRIGKHMEAAIEILPLCSCAQGFTLLTQGELPKSRPCSRRRQCVGRAVPAPEFFEHRSHARTYGQRPPRPPKVAFSRSSPPRGKETDRGRGSDAP